MSNAGQAVLTIGGAIVGGIIGGVPGAQLGYLLGSAAGQLAFPTELPTVRGPRLDDLSIQVSTIGEPIKKIWGRFGAAGNVIWSSGLIEHVEKKKQGGKGGPTQTVETYTYTIDVAIGGPEGPMQGIRRIWADAISIYDKRPQLPDESDEEFAVRLAATAQIDQILTFYTGDETQLPDPTIESYVGVGNALAYRGVSYFVLTGFDCTKYGNRLPNLVAEWYTDGTVSAEHCSEYSVGDLHPWVSSSLDPRNDDNRHTYGYSGFTGLTESAAHAGLEATFGRPMLLNDIHGYKHSSASSTNFPCSETVGEDLELWLLMNSLTVTNVDCSLSGGSCPDFDANWPVHTLVWVGNTPSTGFEFRYLTGESPEQFTGIANGFWTNLDGCLSPSGAMEHLADGVMSVRRSIVPPDPCENGAAIAGAPGFCIVDGQIRPAITWTPVSGTFKALQNYLDDSVNVLSYPVNPCLPSTDPDYNNQTFWEDAYAQALSEGKPIAAGLTYGVDYPVVVSDAYFASCSAESVDIPCYPLAQIVEEICLRCGLTANQIDVTDLTSCVEGYVVSTPMSGRDMIAPLMAFGLFDAVESQGVLRFVERGHPPAATLTVDDLAAHGAGQQRPTVVEVKRQLEESLPRSLRLKYASPDRDYELGEALSSRASKLATDDVVISLPISMSDEAAAQLVDILHTNAWTARTTYQATTTRARLALDAADTILLPVDDRLERMRIIETRYATGGLYALQLVRDDDGSYTSVALPSEPARSGGADNGAGSAVICPSEAILLDIPALRTEDTDAGYYMAVRSLCGQFTCTDLLRSSDDGDSYQWVGRAVNESTIATVLLEDIDGSSPDTLEIQLESGGPLESVTEAQLDEGLNLAAVGADGRWYIFQFSIATLDSSDIWLLQVARGGLFGSAANAATVTAGDRFVLLTQDDLVRIDETPAAIGVEKQFKAVSCGESQDAVDPFNFTTNGLSYVPATPPQHVLSCTLSTPPAAPADGDCYLVPADTGATDAWTGHEGAICCWRDVANAWECSPPPVGVPIFCNESGEYTTPDTSGGFQPPPWTPAIPPLAEIDTSADLATAYLVVALPDGSYRKVLGDQVGSSGQGEIQFQDEGSDIGGPGDITTVNFIGGGVAALVDTTGTLTVSVSASGGSSADTEKAQAADLVITSNTTPTDTDLTFSLSAGTYAIEAFCVVTAHATPDMNIRLNYTGTVTGFRSQGILTQWPAGATFNSGTSTHPHTIFIGTTAAFGLIFDATITVTDSGTLSIQVYQNTSSATSITFHSGSRMRVREIV